MTVFGTEWFKKYNKWIVRLAKLPFIGEWIFHIKKFGFNLDINNLLEIQPNAVVEDMKLMWTKCVKVKGQWIAYDCTNALHNRLIKKECKEKLLPTRRNHYFVRNEYALRLQHVFYPIWITFHIWDIITRPIPQLNLGFDTLTVYPDAGSGSTTVDGYVRRQSLGETFSTIRDSAGTNADTSSTDIFFYLASTGTTNQYGQLSRGIYTFDTSSIGSTPTISSAIISLYGISKSNELGSSELALCSASPSNNANLSSSDYGNLGSSQYNNITYSNFSTSGYNDFSLEWVLNTISKTGITKYGFRLQWDLDNNFGGSWRANKNSYYDTYSSDNGSNKPKLVVTYTTKTTYDKTIQAKARIKMAGNDKTVTSKARVKNSGTTKTIQVKADIKKMVEGSIQSKARIKMIGNDKTIQAKAYIVKFGIVETIQAKADVKKNDITESIQTKARVLKINDSYIESKARILKIQDQTIQAEARIKNIDVEKTIQAKAMIKIANNSESIRSKARIKIVDNDKTIQAKARIKQVGTSKSSQAKGRIKKASVSKSIQAKARIKQAGVIKTIISKARIKNTMVGSIRAKAYIWAAALGVTFGVRKDYAQNGVRNTASIQSGTRLTKNG